MLLPFTRFLYLAGGGESRGEFFFHCLINYLSNNTQLVATQTVGHSLLVLIISLSLSHGLRHFCSSLLQTVNYLRVENFLILLICMAPIFKILDLKE